MNEPDFLPASMPAQRTRPGGDSLFPPDWSYEQTVSQIEGIIDRIEQGELELAEVFDQFATAVEQLRQCETFLNRQQQQVDLLIETLLDEAEPF
ncbi:exodeoxyribonuclease VII small subunit [Leptolyngbya sp. ST-U4]|jgi:exodeoxyribonuclease VII small subunit|nr:exodeoxyribonuclease VII small subunit [Leptolyngbya sp. FACHB-711]